MYLLWCETWQDGGEADPEFQFAEFVVYIRLQINFSARAIHIIQPNCAISMEIFCLPYQNTHNFFVRVANPRKQVIHLY